MMGSLMEQPKIHSLTLTWRDLGPPEVSINCYRENLEFGIEMYLHQECITVPRRFLLNSSELACVMVHSMIDRRQHGRSSEWDRTWPTPIQLQLISLVHRDLFQMWRDLMEPVLKITYQWDFETTVVLKLRYPKWMGMDRVPQKLQTHLKVISLQRKLAFAKRWRIRRWQSLNKPSDYLGME
ncbi:Oncoid [Papillomaviridae sp. Haddock_c2655]|nr:Oncoid [Papillomaviridae sp. Haddock_c2655]